MKKRSIFNKFVENLKIVWKTLVRWGKRAFFGSHKELSLLEEEAVQSPIRVTINKFFHKKLSITALTIFILLFIFCFAGSAFTSGRELYRDPGQKDTAPGFGLLAVPGELKKTGIKDIAIGTTYSVGIDKNGKVYAWGNNLKEINEGYYQTEDGEKRSYTKVDAVTGEYVEATVNDIYTIKESFKLINEAGLKAKKVYAGPDSFFLVMEDNSVRGYGVIADSTSYRNSIVSEELMEEIKRDGVYNITMDNQVVALMTNEQEGATHKLYVWGNIGEGKPRSQNIDSINKEIEADNLNPIDLRWTRDTLVILFENGSYRAYGAADTSAISTQPSVLASSLQARLTEIKLELLDKVGRKIPGYDEAIAESQEELSNAKESYDKAVKTEKEAIAAAKKANVDYNSAKSKTKKAQREYNANPDNVELQKALEAAKEAEATALNTKNEAEAAKQAAIEEKDRLDNIINNSESYVNSIKLEFADEAETYALKDETLKVEVEKINALASELEFNINFDQLVEEVGIKQIRATKGNVIALLNNGTIVTWGDNSSNENQIPEQYQGKFVSIEGDTKGAQYSSHIVAITEDGTVVAWGADANNAIKIPEKLNGQAVDKVYANYYQNIAVDEEGQMIAKWGLSGYMFGTDDSGRSIFFRVMHGGKISLTIGLVAVIISSVIGIIVGGISGFYGGWVDILLMRLGEVVGSIPFMPIAMTSVAICNALGFRDPKEKMVIIMIILGVLSWPGLASLIRAHILAEREKEFVTAAQAVGVKTNKIIFRHIIPNVITIIIISITASYASSLLTESGLSFLGIGVEPPTPTWGNMMTGAQNMNVIRLYWWRWIFPALFLCTATVSINLIGDCIRDAIDPKSTER